MRSPDSRSCQVVLQQWNKSHSAYYRLCEADLRWILHEQNWLYYRPTQLAGTHVIYAVASVDGIKAGLSARSLWLTLWGEIAEKSEDQFVASLCKLAMSEGKTRLSVGGDEFHFTPGVPLESEGGLRLASALARAGFKGSEEVDFVGDVNSPVVGKYIADAQTLACEKNWHWLAVNSESERDELESFLSREFPGRWTREFQFWRSRGDVRRALWMVMKDGNGVLGFSRLGLRSRLLDPDQGWSPASLKLPLSDNLQTARNPNDSFLGPIGVASHLRGQGAGRAVLGLVLDSLKGLNAGRVCIDWTNAIKYYYPLHFAQVRKFGTATMLTEN